MGTRIGYTACLLCRVCMIYVLCFYIWCMSIYMCVHVSVLYVLCVYVYSMHVCVHVLCECVLRCVCLCSAV